VAASSPGGLGMAAGPHAHPGLVAPCTCRAWVWGLSLGIGLGLGLGLGLLTVSDAPP